MFIIKYHATGPWEFFLEDWDLDWLKVIFPSCLSSFCFALFGYWRKCRKRKGIGVFSTSILFLFHHLDFEQKTDAKQTLELYFPFFNFSIKGVMFVVRSTCLQVWLFLRIQFSILSNSPSWFPTTPFSRFEILCFCMILDLSCGSYFGLTWLAPFDTLEH